MNATSSAASAPPGRCGRQVEAADDPPVLLDAVGGDAPEPLRQQGGEEDADGHGFAVPQVPVGMVGRGGGLERVGQGVPVVEDHAATALALVLGDHGRLDAGTAGHLFLNRLVGRWRVAQEGVLGDLAPAAGPLAGRKGREGLGVAEHGVGLPERTDEVLALGEVDPGLAADGRVDLGQQRGGHVQVGRTPVIGRSSEPADVGDDATPDGDDDIGARQSGPGEEASELLHGGQRLGPFPVGDTTDLEGHAGVDPLQPAGVLDRLLGHDHGRLGRGRQEARHLVAGPRADQHRVGAFGQIDGECVHRCLRAALPGLARGVGGVGLRRSRRVHGVDDPVRDRGGLQVVDIEHEVGHLCVERGRARRRGAAPPRPGRRRAAGDRPRPPPAPPTSRPAP